MIFLSNTHANRMDNIVAERSRTLNYRLQLALSNLMVASEHTLCRRDLSCYKNQLSII